MANPAQNSNARINVATNFDVLPTNPVIMDIVASIFKLCVMVAMEVKDGNVRSKIQSRQILLKSQHPVQCFVQMHGIVMVVAIITILSLGLAIVVIIKSGKMAVRARMSLAL